MIKNEYQIEFFSTTSEWEEWLEENHAKQDGIWLRLFKKGSRTKSMTHAQALDSALCFGWIDGQAKKDTEQSWLQKFTPRRAKSIWSKRNREHIERLIRDGKMRPAGLREVEAAKEDGRWQKAYDAPSTMTVPDDFMQILARNKKANAFFKTLNKANIYAIAWRLQTAKKTETREKRIKTILDKLEKNEKLH